MNRTARLLDLVLSGSPLRSPEERCPSEVPRIQDMLYLNKQRLIALDELHKAEAEREYLAARVAQLQAEAEAGEAQRKLLEERLRAADLGVAAAPSSSPTRSAASSKASSKAGSRAGEPASVWSRLLLRVDGLLLAKALSAAQAQALRGLAASRDARAADVYADVEPLEDAQVVRALLRLIDGSNRTLHVVHVCTELAPVAQAGSLATWMAGLCRALRKKGHLVEVVLPLYSSVDTSAIEDFREAPGEIMSFFDNKWHKNKIYTGTVHGLPVTFIHPLHPAAFFQRDHLYDYEDDFERFTYFTRAALEYVQQQGKQPDVLHLHNWHTAVGAPLFWDIYHHQGMPDTRILFTCHDARFQNAQPAGKLAQVGLDPSQLNRPDRLQDNRDPALVNLLKGGIVYSNKVTTVSPTYASDMKTREHGCSLDGTVSIHSQKFAGLPSGLDQSVWDPTRDLALPVPLAASDPMPGKAVARAEVRKRLGLPVIDSASGLERAVVAYVSPQIGEADVELIKGALACSLAYQAQFVLVGAARSSKVQMALEELQRVQQDRNAHLEIVYDDDLAHLVVAAAHVLLCPPLRDPSSHLPLVGARYGAVPVARQLMGSPDSLVDVDDPRRGASEGAGFFYVSDKPADAVTSLTRALKLLIRFILLQNRQGKTRLAKYYVPLEDSEKHKLEFEVHRLVVHREPKFTNFVEFRTYKVIYRRYAGLFFSLCVDLTDNELAYLESIHLFVEILDHFFSNVCELDLVFNFHKAHSREPTSVQFGPPMKQLGAMHPQEKPFHATSLAGLLQSDLPVLSCPLTRFKRQRPPTIDIPRKGCFTSSPAGTPDSAAEDALDGVVEVAESGACFAVACKRGRKAVMEDTYQALMGFAERESDAFFGVFDGHGGTAAAKFAAAELASHVARAAARTGGQASAAAVVEGYLETDRRFLDQNVASGTSCLTCWATPGRLLLAHAGDCKAVLVKGGRAVALTEDHRASREDEQARITALGGFVDTATGMPRVQGILAVTRGMGDAHLKSFITPQPDVAQVRVGADCSALILASDGLWDVVAPQDAADVVTACVVAAVEARAAAGEAQAAAGEAGSTACALLRPPASPPCKRARTQRTQGWSAEPRQEREGTRERERECRKVFSSPLGTPPCTPRSHATPTTPPCTPHSRASSTPPGMPRPPILNTATTTTTATATATTTGTNTSTTTTPPTPRRLFSPHSIARPPFTPPWLDAPSEPAVCVGPHAVAAEGPTTVAGLPQGSVAVLVGNEESEGDGNKKGAGNFPNEMGKGDCSGGGVSEEGGSERVTRGLNGEVLLSACQALVGMAAARGSRDDITVMLVSLAPFAESATS
ncbi:unnamed protein product [Closterium sp. Naga37s-1]|nr:unnamed protein product [Closterium sp. Naga37s-1]